MRNEIFRFLIAGILVTTVDVVIYYLLFHFLPFSLSKGISFTCAGVVGYVINKYWTFKQVQASYAEVRRFILINFLALGVNVFINQIVLYWQPGAVYLALTITTVFTSILIFICFKWWVYKTPAV